MGPDDRWVWKRRAQYSEAGFAETNNDAKISVHVRAAIGIGFKSPLLVFEQNVDSMHDIDSLQKSGFFGLADGRFRARGWYLVQDGAPCQTSARSMDALFQLCHVFPQ
jgi:hypothetical protein